MIKGTEACPVFGAGGCSHKGWGLGAQHLHIQGLPTGKGAGSSFEFGPGCPTCQSPGHSQWLLPFSLLPNGLVAPFWELCVRRAEKAPICTEIEASYFPRACSLPWSPGPFCLSPPWGHVWLSGLPRLGGEGSNPPRVAGRASSQQYGC